MLINFPNFISLCFISKIEFSEIYQYAFISMVILVNVISMKIISIFSYFEKISVSGSITFQVFSSFVCDFYFFTRFVTMYCQTQIKFHERDTTWEVLHQGYKTTWVQGYNL